MAMVMYQRGDSLAEIAKAVGKPTDLVRDYFSRRELFFPDTRKICKWDTEKALGMFHDGASDREIAEAVGVEVRRVRRFFQKLGYCAG